MRFEDLKERQKELFLEVLEDQIPVKRKTKTT